MTVLSSQSSQAVQTLVYVRQASVYGGPLPVDGDNPQSDATPAGWVLSPHLRCEEARWLAGLAVGDAKFTYIPSGESDRPFNLALAPFSIDDQVHVEVLPLQDTLSQQATPGAGPGGGPDASVWPGSLGGGRVVFEGVLGRPVIDLQASGGRGRETVRFVAQAFPLLDGVLTGHLVKGRWLASRSFTGQVTDIGYAGQDGVIIEAPDLPCCFNFRGRPNQHGSATVVSGVGLSGPMFSDEDDPTAVFWTFQSALAALLAVYLYGPAESTDWPNGIPRHVDLASDAEAALVATAPVTDQTSQYYGLNMILPEANIHGLGLWEALSALCRVAGFEFSAVPSADPLADRTYVLDFWRVNHGEIVTLDLDERGSLYPDAQTTLAANNLGTLQALRDSTSIRNEIFGIARVYVQAPFTLYPLWSPSDVDTQTINTQLQTGGLSGDQLTALNNTSEDDGNYWGKSVQGGALFLRYGHVGRVWGLSCGGGIPYYPASNTAYYCPGSGTGNPGFDFVTYLGLNTPGAVAPAVSPATDRAANGVTDPIVWSARVRQALPLRDAGARVDGREYYLEATEDGGTTWSECPVHFSTLVTDFGIRLDVPNLADVCNDYLRTSGDQSYYPDPLASWWGLISTGKLQFRLTACVVADHAQRVDALRRSTSGSQYQRGQMWASTAEQVWVQAPAPPASDLPTGWQVFSSWDPGIPGNIPSQNPSILTQVQRRQDRLEDSRFSGTARTWVMDFGRYQLGDRVSQVRGRNYSLASNQGAALSYPNIVGIRLVLGLGGQGIELMLQDMASLEDRNWS